MKIYALLDAGERINADVDRLKVLIYVLERVDRHTYEFRGSYGDIVKGTGVNPSTVERTMQYAAQIGFIKHVKRGVWHVEEEIFTEVCDENYEGPELTIKDCSDWK